MQFSTGAEDFLSSGTTVPAVLSKLRSTCPAQHFDGKCFTENCF